MIISRNFTRIINTILDDFCPPIIRDNFYLMYPIYRIAYGKETKKLFDFKNKISCLSEEEYKEYYSIASKTKLAKRPTDLNYKSLAFIMKQIKPNTKILDAGCGRGFLASKIAKKGNTVVGLDIEKPSNTDGYVFVEGSIDNMPFNDKSFDVVICAHVLEHVLNLEGCISELLRIYKKQLIIVLPRQREYKYLADLHIRFFPYEYCVRKILPKNLQDVEILQVGGDWCIVINKERID